MAISLVRRLEPWWFTPKSQENQREPARFLLAPLSQQRLLEVKHLIYSEHATLRDRAEGSRLAAHAAIIGWENIKDAEDKPVAFGPELIAELPSNLMVAIGTEAVRASMLMEDEVKNSSSPSTSANGRSSSNADGASADAARTASGEAPSRDGGSSKASASKPANASPSGSAGTVSNS